MTLKDLFDLSSSPAACDKVFLADAMNEDTAAAEILRDFFSWCAGEIGVDGFEEPLESFEGVGGSEEEDCAVVVLVPPSSLERPNERRLLASFENGRWDAPAVYS